MILALCTLGSSPIFFAQSAQYSSLKLTFLFLLESRPSYELHLTVIGTYPPRPILGENLLRVEFEGWFLRPTLAETFDFLR